MAQETGARRSVLVVEDEADVRAAIETLEHHGFDLVLTDLQLPGADGLMVLEAARRFHPAIFVVIVTGFASLDSAIQAVRLGAYDYLTKPFSLGQIDVVLSRITNLTDLHAENARLTRQVAQQDGSDLRHAFLRRLEGIENRLTRIEAALRPRG